MKTRFFLLAFVMSALGLPVWSEETSRSEQLAREEKEIKISDGVLREYRLAVLFTREEFVSPRFNRDREKIRAHLQELEAQLNELYVRDAGVKFTIVYDDRLIDPDLPSNNVYIDNTNTSTKCINDRIGEDSYDVGVCCNYYGSPDSPGKAGEATVGGLAYGVWKGNLVSSKQENRTILHEMAHLFGCQHPWLNGSEPGNSGQSIAGYGFSSPTLFLSLASLGQLLPTVQRADNLRNASYRRSVCAVNTPPRINRQKMKREYVVPRDTFFTLPVYAEDDEQAELNYASAQWDYQAYRAAHFPAFPSTRDPVLRFGRTYNRENFTKVLNSDSLPVGEYKMLISVSDALPWREAVARQQAPLRDNFLTIIKVVDVENPFKIATDFKGRKMTTGERLLLTWNVDAGFFNQNGYAESKVRVLLSEDGGLTFPYVLVPETANDGECEIVIPQRVVPHMTTYSVTVPSTGQVIPIYSMGAAVLRLEMIGGLGFYDLTDDTPNDGGATVAQSPIVFANLPADNCLTLAPDAEMPPVPALTATCNGRSVAVTYSESTEGRVTRRLWTATEGSATSSFVQWIVRSASGVSD